MSQELTGPEIEPVVLALAAHMRRQKRLEVSGHRVIGFGISANTRAHIPMFFGEGFLLNGIPVTVEETNHIKVEV